MFFDDWSKIFRVLIVGVFAYASVIFLLRISGKRTLSKWNAFDFIVTIALGSTLATVITSKDTALLEGIAAFGLLIGLQFIITWISVRWLRLQKIIKATPSMLLEDGEFRHKILQMQRVSEEEVRMAIRSAGIGGIEEVAAVVLETDGSFSVIKKSSAGSRSSLSDVIK